MRIRRGRKPYYVTLCTVSNSSDEVPSHDSYVPSLPQTHVCLTNRPRWEVMDLLPKSPPPSPTRSEQNVRKASVDEDVNVGESLIHTILRNANQPETIEDIKEEDIEPPIESSNPKKKNKGKREPPMEICSKRASRVREKKPSKALQGQDYYFYSGFGPLWDSKRARVGVQIKERSGEDESDEDADDGRLYDLYQMKKWKKPFKARSLETFDGDDIYGSTFVLLTK